MFFALHLFGVFEVGYLFTRIRRGHEKEGLGGSFLAGMTATLVATPCTGPFMGTAMAYAFTRSEAVSFGIFTALGPAACTEETLSDIVSDPGTITCKVNERVALSKPEGLSQR